MLPEPLYVVNEISVMTAVYTYFYAYGSKHMIRGVKFPIMRANVIVAQYLKSSGT